MKIETSWVHSKTSQSILNLLSEAGFDAYFVGGCVRNSILGAGTTDIDIATNATPEQVLTLASKENIRAIPTGIDHGTVTLVLSGESFEITTFRKDVETDGRRAVVAFSDNILEDARRRDFTMNALYADRLGQVIDPLGTGLNDAKSRYVRFIDDAELRIKEDGLRILRFFRFYAWYGDSKQGMDAEGLAACAAGQEILNTLSKERITSELIKLLGAKEPTVAISSMEQSGILTRVLPGASAKALGPLCHLAQSFDLSWHAKLAALGPMQIKQDLRLSKSDERHVSLLRNLAEASDRLGQIAFYHGEKVAMEVNLLRCALLEMPVSPDVIHEIAKGASASFPIASQDLMKWVQGKELGDALRDLEKNWLDSDFEMTKEELMQGFLNAN